MAAGIAEPQTQAPLCFVSYVHDDAEDGHLRPFFEDLARQVADLNAQEPAEVLFVDRSSIVTGQLWDARLTDALARAKVFVAIYTPRYFNQAEIPCFCGREFAAFWDRSARQAVQSNILPVLWLVPKATQDSFIPSAVRAIQWTLNDAGANPQWIRTYEKEGLRAVLVRKSKKAYDNLVLDIANQIGALLESAPPELLEPPQLEQVVCAFHEGEGVAAVPLAGPGNLSAEHGPKHVELIYVTDDPDALPSTLGGVWLSKLLFSPDLQTHITRWPIQDNLATLEQTLRQASANGQIPLVVLPADGDPVALKKLAGHLVALSGWTGAVLAPAGVELPRRTDAVRVLETPDAAAPLASAVTDLVQEIRRQLTLEGEVHQRGTGPGPDRIPRL